jgi:hypothetical protein
LRFNAKGAECIAEVAKKKLLGFLGALFLYALGV